MNKPLTVYLAGAMFGQSDDSMKGWRLQAKEKLVGLTILDPTDRDYRGIEDQHVAEIIELDKQDIDNCDILLVNASIPSWGTVIEIIYAWSTGTTVLLIVPKDKPITPWLQYYSDMMFYEIDDACKYINVMNVTPINETPEW